MNRRLFLLLISSLCFVSCPSLLAADAAAQEDAIARMRQAVAKTNIFELPSFSMKAAVQVEEGGKPVDGTYQLFWNGPDQWREEIVIPGYHEIQIGGKGTIWLQRNTDFMPVQAFSIHQALGFGSSAGSPANVSLVRLNLNAKDFVKKQRDRIDHGNKLTCFEIEKEDRSSSEICLYSDTGTIARDSDSVRQADLQPVGTKLFPRILGETQAGKELANVSISELTSPAQFPPETFTPPNGVSPRRGCMNPMPARLVRRINPEYPGGARAEHIQGTVKVDVQIGTDGLVTIHKVVGNPNSDLTKSALQALKDWRYTPSTCDNEPVELSTILQVRYTLSPR